MKTNSRADIANDLPPIAPPKKQYAQGSQAPQAGRAPQGYPVVQAGQTRQLAYAEQGARQPLPQPWQPQLGGQGAPCPQTRYAEQGAWQPVCQPWRPQPEFREASRQKASRTGKRRKLLTKRQRRTIVDILLSAMLIFEMFYQFTGNLLHELVGFALFFGVALHLLLSKRWIAGTVGALGRTALNRTRKRLLVIAVLLMADVLVLMFSSLVISRTLWGLGLNLSWMDFGGIWTILHTASAYGVCVLAVVHLSMHWITMAKSLRIEYDPSRRRAIGYGVNLVAGLGVVALGMTGAAETAEAMAAIAAANGARESRENGEASSVQETGQPEVNDRAMTDSARKASTEEEGRQSQRGQGQEQERAGAQDGNGGDTQNATDDSGELPAKDASPTVEEQATDTAQNPEYHEEQVESPAFEEQPEAQDYEQTWEEPPVEEEPADSQEGGDYAAGICTLCRKQCSLSAPQCNLPYEAGLL